MPAARRAIGPMLAVALAAAALAGCGSDSSSAGATASAPAPPSGAPQMSADRQAQFERLRACLKRQGVDLPAGGPGGPPGGSAGGAPGGTGGPPQVDQEAMQACSKYLPQGGPPGMGAPPGASS